MTHKVSSYAAGSWYVSPEPGAIVRDPTTGAEVAEVSSAGLDVGAMVEHARTAGGPALRALTFHERAGLLKRLAAALSERTSEVYADYATSGGTRADAQVDVEGGIQVLSVYAKQATRELPNDTVIVEHEPEALLGRPDFVGQTILTSRHGLAVLINAFNFPVWGMLEKLAQCLLAGLPVIVKPASVTAHLTEVAFRHIVESGVLPQGAVQLISGSAGSLLDHLGGQDHVSFTGSAQTAAILRAHPAVVARGTSFNPEADSLNATILGPDAEPDTDEFALFVKAVAREMSSKCGQKCTAIRRVLVPSEQLDAVIVGVRHHLDRGVIGDPRDEATTIGPLVSADQRADVESAVRQIMESATVAIGGPDVAVGPSEASGQGGFFAPTLLVASDRRDPRVHSIEAFGPVATIIPYDSATEAAELTALGEGSLVASVVSNDSAFVREIVRGIAPFHGRVLVLNRDIARGSTPHGAVLPQLIHGGPGRAGGGEELGGMRGVSRLLQATSVASSAQMNVALTDSWNAGAAELTPQVHPFRLHLEELRIGDTLRTGSRKITLEDIEHFAEFTGDTFYAHMDEEAAKASPLFEGRVAHGYFIIAAAAGLFVDPDPGPVLANFGLEALRFIQPVYPGDEIKLRLTAKKKTVRPGAGRGEVTWDVEVTNQRDEKVATYQLLTINASKTAEGASSLRPTTSLTPSTTTTGLASPRVSYAASPSGDSPARQSSTTSDTRVRSVITQRGHTMSEIAETLTMIQQEILRQIRTGQAVTVETTRLVADFVASPTTGRGRQPRMPQAPKEAREGQQEAIDAAFAFARAVLELNAEFARSLSRLPASTPSVSNGVSEPVEMPAWQSFGTMPTMSFVPAMPVMPSLPGMPAMPSWPNPTAMQLPTIPGWSPTSLADSARNAAAAITAAFGAAGSAAVKAGRAASATPSAAAEASKTKTPVDGTEPSVTKVQQAKEEAQEAAMRAQLAQAEAAAKGDEDNGAADESASTPVGTPSKSPTGTARTTATAPATAAATKKTASKKTATKKTASKKTATKKTASKKTASKKTASKKTASKKATAKKAAVTTSSAPKAADQTSAGPSSAAKDEAAETPVAAVELPEGAVASAEVAEKAGFKPAGGAAKQEVAAEDSDAEDSSDA